MADFADDAQAMEELALSHAIASARKTGERQLAPRGFCYNCDDLLKKVKVKVVEKQPVDGKEIEVPVMVKTMVDGVEVEVQKEEEQDVKLFCDEFCSEDWHKRTKIQSRR
jgi:hypothetical protein